MGGNQPKANLPGARLPKIHPRHHQRRGGIRPSLAEIQRSHQMSPQQIKEIQTKIGVEADGFWGPISTRACEDYLRQFMPKPNPWPKTDQASLTAFYGKPGDESKRTRIDVTGLGVKY